MSYACYRIYDTCDVTKPRSVRVTTTYHDDEHVTYDTCREWERTHRCAHGRIYAYTTPPAPYATYRRNSGVYWSTERYDVLNEHDGTNVHGIFGVCTTQRAIPYTRYDCMLVTNTTWAILWPYQYVSIAVPDVIIPYEVASNISHRLRVRVLRNNVSTAIVASAITLAAYSYRDINDDMDEYTLLWNSHDVFVFDNIKAQQNSVYAIERLPNTILNTNRRFYTDANDDYSGYNGSWSQGVLRRGVRFVAQDSSVPVTYNDRVHTATTDEVS